MKKGRKNYSAEFKTKVVLELLSRDHTLNEVAERHEISPATLCVWHKLFQERASLIFEKGPSEQDKQLSEHKEEIDALHKKVGQLTIECDWLKKNLTKSLDHKERIELVSSDNAQSSPVAGRADTEQNLQRAEKTGCMSYQ